MLCQCKEAVDPIRVPDKLLPAESEERWKVLVVKKSVPSPTTPTGYAAKLSQFLMQEGKSMSVIQAL